MKVRILSLILLWSIAKLGFAASVTTADSVRIGVQIGHLSNQKLYLGSYYGKFQTLLDSVQLDKQGKGQFTAGKKYVSGIYFLVNAQRQLLFEFLMDAQQQFQIKQDNLNEKPIFSGSADNDFFSQYNHFLEEKYPLIQGLQQKLKGAAKADSIRILNDIRIKSKEIEAYRESFEQQHPNSLLSFLFRSIKNVQLPDSLQQPRPEQYALVRELVRKQYWTGIDFADDRLLRTPFYDSKLMAYFNDYVSPEPEEIIKQLSPMLSSAHQKNGEQFKYLLTRFTDKYINPEIMGQDKVFLYLFNQYYAKETYQWLTEKQKNYLFDRAYSLMTNQIGDPAPVLDLTGLKGEKQRLYQLKARLTLVVFWDPGCGHCQKELPRIDSIYRASWKAKGLKIFAVNVNEAALKATEDFILKNHLEEWIHAYQPEAEKLRQQQQQIPNFRQLYDVSQTPTIYLLDENKKILAKKLDIVQLDKLVSAY